MLKTEIKQTIKTLKLIQKRSVLPTNNKQLKSLICYIITKEEDKALKRVIDMLSDFI